MRRRGSAVRLGAAVTLTCGVLVAGAWAASAAAAPPAAQPQIGVSTTTIVPGQQVVVTGRGWPHSVLVNISTCGADAVDGTVDCASPETATVQSFRTGMLTARITGALPPKPCPCVVMARGAYTNVEATTPVTVVGALTAPVPTAPTVTQPDVQISDLRALSSVTIGSAMGTSTERTVELQIQNSGQFTETPVLIGRWGRPADVRNTITMPYVGPLAPGTTKDVRATFILPALSFGTYDVRVVSQVVGFTATSRATTSTTQWPFGLFAVVALFVLLVVVALVTGPRRRRQRRAAPPPPPFPPPPPPPYQAPREPARLAAPAGSGAGWSQWSSSPVSGRQAPLVPPVPAVPAVPPVPRR